MLTYQPKYDWLGVPAIGNLFWHPIPSSCSIRGCLLSPVPRKEMWLPPPENTTFEWVLSNIIPSLCANFHKKKNFLSHLGSLGLYLVYSRRPALEQCRKTTEEAMWPRLCSPGSCCYGESFQQQGSWESLPCSLSFLAFICGLEKKKNRIPPPLLFKKVGFLIFKTWSFCCWIVYISNK